MDLGGLGFIFLVEGGGVGFLLLTMSSHEVPIVLPSCYQWVPNIFPKFLMCSPCPISFGLSSTLVTYTK
jgi:hypothetical protein